MTMEALGGEGSDSHLNDENVALKMNQKYKIPFQDYNETLQEIDQNKENHQEIHHQNYHQIMPNIALNHALNQPPNHTAPYYQSHQSLQSHPSQHINPEKISSSVSSQLPAVLASAPPLSAAVKLVHQQLLPKKSFHMESFYGYLSTTEDASLIVYGSRIKDSGVKLLTRRLIASERLSIRSGSIFCYTEEESGMKRWTDNRQWTKSRIDGNFLIYKQIGESVEVGGSSVDNDLNYANQQKLATSFTDDENTCLRKKTFSLIINGMTYHVVSYYTKSDIESGILKRPRTLEFLKNVVLPSEFLNHENFRLARGSIKQTQNVKEASTYHPYSNAKPASRPKNLKPDTNSTVLNTTVPPETTHSFTSTPNQAPQVIPHSPVVHQPAATNSYITCHLLGDPQLIRIGFQKTFHDFKTIVMRVFGLQQRDSLQIVKGASTEIKDQSSYQLLKHRDIVHIKLLDLPPKSNQAVLGLLGLQRPSPLQLQPPALVVTPATIPLPPLARHRYQDVVSCFDVALHPKVWTSINTMLVIIGNEKSTTSSSLATIYESSPFTKLDCRRVVNWIKDFLTGRTTPEEWRSDILKTIAILLNKK